jgi:hypothetical protein
MDSIDNALIETRQKLREARIANDKLRGSLAIMGDQYKELERENARLRAIFPRILEALQSGACAPDCSVEFFEMIPNEVAGVMRKLRMPNAKDEGHG